MKATRHSNRSATIAQTQKSQAAAKKDYSNSFAALDDHVCSHEGQKCEIEMWERRFNSRGEKVYLHSGCRSDFGLSSEISYESALVITRFYNDMKELELTQLQINSPYIRQALKSVIGSYPGVNINCVGPILIPGDPKCLFHYRNELQSYGLSCRDTKAREHIDFCLQYLNKVLGREIASYEELMLNGDLAPGLEFQNLWMAFKPGELLYEMNHGVDVISRLRSMAKVTPSRQPEYWNLTNEIIMCDGKNFGFVSKTVKIPSYDGYRPLTQLGVFPLDHHQHAMQIRASLLDRGKKYASMLGAHHCSYDGVAAFDGCYGYDSGQQVIRIGTFPPSWHEKNWHYSNVSPSRTEHIL